MSGELLLRMEQLGEKNSFMLDPNQPCHHGWGGEGGLGWDIAHPKSQLTKTLAQPGGIWPLNIVWCIFPMPEMQPKGWNSKQKVILIFFLSVLQNNLIHKNISLCRAWNFQALPGYFLFLSVFNSFLFLEDTFKINPIEIDNISQTQNTLLDPKFLLEKFNQELLIFILNQARKKNFIFSKT